MKSLDNFKALKALKEIIEDRKDNSVLNRSDLLQKVAERWGDLLCEDIPVAMVAIMIIDLAILRNQFNNSDFPIDRMLNVLIPIPTFAVF